MRFPKILAFCLGAAGASGFGSSAIAGQPYKCVGADGKITFTDTKCDAQAQPQRVSDSHLGSPDTPPADVTDAPQSASQTAPQQSVPLPQGAERGGYQCSTAPHEWVQLSPCPRTLMENAHTRVSIATAPTPTSTRTFRVW
jgi:hypothetical protein